MLKATDVKGLDISIYVPSIRLISQVNVKLLKA